MDTFAAVLAAEYANNDKPPSVWRIDGEASCDSGGGVIAIYAITHAMQCDWMAVPDPDTAIRLASKGKYTWYRIDSIRRVDGAA